MRVIVMETRPALGFDASIQPTLLRHGQLHENGAGRDLKVLVNGLRIEDPGNYIIVALDKILITYGDETDEELQALLETIPDGARQIQDALNNPP